MILVFNILFNYIDRMLLISRIFYSRILLLADEAAYTEEQLMLRIDLLEELKIGIDHFSRSLYVLNFEID